MILFPGKTLIKLIQLPKGNPTIEPFKHTLNEVYLYLGKIKQENRKSSNPDSFYDQFIRVKRLRDGKEFVQSKSDFGDLKFKQSDIFKLKR